MRPAYTINVLYDGNCEFLVRMTRLAKRLDRARRVHLTDIAARKFEARLFDRSQHELTAEIHVRRPDGMWFKGMDAVRELCSAVGLGSLVLLTRLPVIRQLSDVGYRLCARMLFKTSRSAANNPVRDPMVRRGRRKVV